MNNIFHKNIKYFLTMLEHDLRDVLKEKTSIDVEFFVSAQPKVCPQSDDDCVGKVNLQIVVDPYTKEARDES